MRRVRVDRHQLRSLVGQRQQRVTFCAAETTPGMLPEEEDDEREDQTETDREGKRNDRHEEERLSWS